MARKSKSRRSSEVTPTPRPLTFTLPRPSKITAISLRAVEDRRTHHPSPSLRPARVLSGNRIAPLRPKRPQKNKLSTIPRKVSFAVPKQTLICIRREQRKQVLHAFGRVGRGKAGGSRRRNRFSEVSCKR